MKYFVSLFLSLFFLVFISCGNEDNAWDNNIPIITSNEQMLLWFFRNKTHSIYVFLCYHRPTLNTIPIIYFKYQISKYYKIYHHWATGKFLEYYKCSYYQSRYYRCRVDSRSYNSWRFMSTNESYLFRSIWWSFSWVPTQQMAQRTWQWKFLR